MQVIGHEMMHGFDVLGRKFDDQGYWHDWWTQDTLKQYVNRTLCIRSAHKQVVHKPSILRASVLN